MQEQKRKKQNKSMNKGVTLIALVVTIIVLLILAGVTITAVTGRKGIIKEATTAKEKSEKADLEEQIDIAIIQAEGESTNTTMNDVIQKLLENGIIESVDKVNQKTGEIITKKPSYLITGKLDDYIIVVPPGNPDAEGIFTKNSTINGAIGTYNNPEIPKGFKPVDVDIAVWGDGTRAPTQEAVNAGLVIEDDLGNQFVWIPVDGGLYNGTLDTTKVQLGRYVFKDDGSIDEALSQSTSEGQLKESSSNSEYYTEAKKDETTGNTHAKDIDGFKRSVASHGGYYIARYEASKGKNNKPASKVSTSATASTTTISEGMLWIYINQADAAIACQNMYDSNYGVTSDLMNSYAWDTAIVFMQKYGDSTYSRYKSKNTSLANTGVNGDEQCHIYDMASNCLEWTTETFSVKNFPCVNRGGCYNGNIGYTSYRGFYSTTSSTLDNTFRPLLYL